MSAAIQRLRAATTLALLGAVLASGCGFQLRGAAGLPPELDVTRIEAPDPDAPFVRELRAQLVANGVRLATGAAEPAARLVIRESRIRRRALSIAADARVREYELVFELVFDLYAPDGSAMIRGERLRQVRDYQFDAQEILGAANEEELLREDMIREMARSVLRRLEAVAQP
ncbi:MAG: hypothetical protein Kow0020_00690 [Wenzhouxiangellaceae bacterium]